MTQRPASAISAKLTAEACATLMIGSEPNVTLHVRFAEPTQMINESCLWLDLADMAETEHIEAHKHCAMHRDEIEASDLCGCFYCKSIFQPSEIASWIDELDSPRKTALCPRCGIDSVIGSASGFPITEEFLWRMYRHWF